MLGSYLPIKNEDMKTLKNYRYWLLLLLSLVAAVGIFGLPTDNLPILQWVTVLTASKVVGFGAGYLAYNLLKQWVAEGKLPIIEKLITDEKGI